MMDATKYAPGYYPAPAGYDSWVKKDHIEAAPAFCSVDLRDGNQALIVSSGRIIRGKESGTTGRLVACYRLSSLRAFAP